VLERCERCGLGIAAGVGEDDAAAALLGEAHELPGGKLELTVANRASIQATWGGAHWAAVEPGRRIYPTPDSLPALGAAAGLEIEELRFPGWGRGQGWMWQTILNGLTFHDNFAREARVGRLRPTGGAGERLKFALDVVVTLLAALPAALLSAPLELVAALFRRGGEITAVARRS